MSQEMGTFRIDVDVEHPNSTVRQTLQASVDTGAKLSWFPAAFLDSLGIRRLKQWHFRQADDAGPAPAAFAA